MINPTTEPLSITGKLEILYQREISIGLFVIAHRFLNTKVLI